MSPALILAVGRDPVLLDTRKQILQSVGYAVTPVLLTNETLTQFPHGHFDIVILCHSIPGGDRKEIVRLFREQSSRTPIVFVSSIYGDNDPSADATVGRPSLHTSRL